MIDRRGLLSCLGASVTGALAPRFVDAAPLPQSSSVLALESFHLAAAEHLPRLHAYLNGVVLPFINETHRAPGICLEAIVAPQAPQALVLTAFSNFDDMLSARTRIAADPHVQSRRAELESSGILLDVRSQLLIAPQPLNLPDSRHSAGIFELRSYHCASWNPQPPAIVAAAFQRAGIHPILNAASAAGEHLPQFTYLVPFESMAAREDAWSRLAADPDWLTIERESSPRATAKSIFKLAPGSRLS